uniref:Uncharacterized protein n=1 Tax=Arundo donax TaxID=35708 RepID=A0A0A9A6W0_ARUDO
MGIISFVSLTLKRAKEITLTMYDKGWDNKPI